MVVCDLYLVIYSQRMADDASVYIMLLYCFLYKCVKVFSLRMPTFCGSFTKNSSYRLSKKYSSIFNKFPLIRFAIIPTIANNLNAIVGTVART